VKVGAVAEMQGRDLLRRRLALLLLLAVPLAFTTAAQHGAAYNDAPFRGGIGMAFSVTGVALFAMLAARRIDPRLLLAGFRAWQLVLGRLVLLLVAGLAVAGLFYGYLVALWAPARPGVAVVGLVEVALVSVPVGLMLAALLPRELEGMLVLIGLVGVEESLSFTSLGARLLPHYGAARFLVASEDAYQPVHTLRWSGYSLAWALATLALALGLWWRRTAIRRSSA
jgi:hypothetical protein